MKTSKDTHLFELAKRGAEVRLRELAHDAKHLLGFFPHLRDSFDPDELPLSFLIADGAGATPGGTPSRRRQSAAARKAARKQTRRDWVARRKAAART